VDAPFAELDALYTNILLSVSDRKKTLAILGFLILNSELNSMVATTSFIDDFLMLSEGDTYIVSGELASVVTLGPHKYCGRRGVNLLHASLGDFLLDRARSNQFALDPAEVHAQLACMCLRTLQRSCRPSGKLLAKDQTLSFMILFKNHAVYEFHHTATSVYRYACDNLIKHCSAGAPTALFWNTFQQFLPNSHLELQSIPICLAAIKVVVSSSAGDRKSNTLLTDI
jgi:hypothetical protein